MKKIIAILLTIIMMLSMAACQPSNSGLNARIDPDEITSIINSHDRTNAGMTAPPYGLYLNKVTY